MRILKNTIFNVYQRDYDENYCFLKYPNTTLFQSFNHLGYDFEVRISKDGKTAYIAHKNIVLDSNNVTRLKNEFNKSENWFTSLNWEGIDEQITEVENKLSLIKNE